jgi:hypothetical protein
VAAVANADTNVSTPSATAIERGPKHVVGDQAGLLEHGRELERKNNMLTGLATKRQGIIHEQEATVENLRTTLETLQTEKSKTAEEYEQVLGYFNTVQRENKQLNVSAHNLQQKVNYLGRVQQNNEELKRQAQESAKDVSLCTALQKENGELKSRLLKLQLASILSDPQINEKYIASCDDIEDWIVTNLGDTDGVVRRAMSAGDNDTYGRRVF